MIDISKRNENFIFGLVWRIMWAVIIFMWLTTPGDEVIMEILGDPVEQEAKP